MIITDLCFLSAGILKSYGKTVTDQLNRQVTVPDDPKRVVALAPSITETLFALGLGEKVTGVTRFCTYPPEVQLVTKVGGFLDPNYEVIASLKPDLVVLLPEHHH